MADTEVVGPGSGRALFDELNSWDLWGEEDRDSPGIFDCDIDSLRALADGLRMASPFRWQPFVDPFSFLANSSLSGAGDPCFDGACRVARALDLSRFAALYAETVLIRDPFEAVANDEDHEKLRLDFAHTLSTLKALQPLLEAGVVAFAPTVFPFCPEGVNELRRVEAAIRERVVAACESLIEEVLERVQVEIRTKPEYAYLAISGIEEYLAHPGIDLVPLEKGSRWTGGKGLSDADVRDAVQTWVLDPSVIDLQYRYVINWLYNARYLTDRPLDVDFLRLLDEEADPIQRPSLGKVVSHSLPFVDGLDTEALLKLRRDEGEAFQVYRDRVRTLVEQPDLTEMEFREAFRDLVQPQLNQIDNAVAMARKMVKRSVREKLIFGTGMVTIGLAAGTVTPAAGAIISAMGGSKVRGRSVVQPKCARQRAGSGTSKRLLFFMEGPGTFGTSGRHLTRRCTCQRATRAAGERQCVRRRARVKSAAQDGGKTVLKRTVAIIVICMGLASSAVQAQGDPPTRPRDGLIVQQFRDWAREHAHELEINSAGFPVAQAALERFAPLREIVGDARVVAIGEPFHGAHEPLTARNLLVQYLVTHMGFTAVALETGLSPSKRLYDHVRLYTEESDSAFGRSFSYAFGRYRENLDLVKWLRSYNAERAPNERVGLYGMDIAAHVFPPAQPSVDAVLEYLESADSGLARIARAEFSDIAGEFRIDRFVELPEAEQRRIAVAVDDLVTLIRRRRNDLTSATSRDEYDWALRQALNARYDVAYMRLASPDLATLFTTGSGPDVDPSEAQAFMEAREASIAENVSWVLGREGAGGRVVVFAHNLHLQGHPVAAPPGQGVFSLLNGAQYAGTYLRSMMGEDLLVIGVHFGDRVGFSSARSSDVEDLERLLSSPGLPGYILDLRGLPAGSPLKDWLEAEHLVREPLLGEHLLSPIRAYDVIWYIDRVTPAKR